MDSEQDVTGQHGGCNSRRSPRIGLQNKRKGKEQFPLKERRKRLRLEVVEENAESDDDDEEEDADFAPADAGAAAGADVGEKKKTKSIRCSPSNFKRLVAALPDDLKSEVHVKGFGGLLEFKPHVLSRKLLSWLMRKLNPETMKLEIGGGKEIPITEHNMWCIFQLPNSGGDPPPMTDKDARDLLDQLRVQICGNGYSCSKGIQTSVIADGLQSGRLTGELGLRAFYMGAFRSLLFSNTDSRIRVDDVRYTQDLENIRFRNW